MLPTGIASASSTENFRVKSLLFLFFCWPPKRIQFATLGPQRTFAKKWWALKVLRHIKGTEYPLARNARPMPVYNM
jgi:hypothetical protein